MRFRIVSLETFLLSCLLVFVYVMFMCMYVDLGDG